MGNQQLLQIRAPYLSTTHQPHHPTSIYQHFTASYPVISGKKKNPIYMGQAPIPESITIVTE